MTTASGTQTFGFRDAVELAVVERSGFVESRHGGSAVVLSPDGTVLRSLGDPSAPIFPRSTLKPFQAIAAMTSGVTLRGEDAAIATASHSGTARHVELVRGLLARENIPESALACPAAYPHDAEARDAAVRAGTGKQRIFMTCSGKHAAMLLACVANDWPLESYLSAEHPLQKRVLDVIERFTGERPVASGVDGCGTPVHAISLLALARGIHRVGTSTPASPFAIFREAGVLAEAVRENPWVVAGPGQQDTVAIERFGVFAKFGAEGIMVMVAPNGTTVTLKILDGSTRAATIVALRLLADAGALDHAAVNAHDAELGLLLTGADAVVGSIRVSF